jgi:hypothetical protein
LAVAKIKTMDAEIWASTAKEPPAAREQKGTVISKKYLSLWNEGRAARIGFLSIDPGDTDAPLHALAVPDADPMTPSRCAFGLRTQTLEEIRVGENDRRS